MKAGLTIEEKLFLHCLSGSRREAAFLQPLCIKDTDVLVGPYDGDLWRDESLLNWFVKVRFFFLSVHLIFCSDC